MQEKDQLPGKGSISRRSPMASFVHFTKVLWGYVILRKFGWQSDQLVTVCPGLLTNDLISKSVIKDMPLSHNLTYPKCLFTSLKSLGCPRHHSDLRRSARCGRPINQWNNGAAVDRPGEKLPIVYLGGKEDDRSDAPKIRRHIDCVWSDFLPKSRGEIQLCCEKNL